MGEKRFSLIEILNWIYFKMRLNAFFLLFFVELNILLCGLSSQLLFCLFYIEIDLFFHRIEKKWANEGEGDEATWRDNQGYGEQMILDNVYASIWCTLFCGVDQFCRMQITAIYTRTFETNQSTDFVNRRNKKPQLIAWWEHKGIQNLMPKKLDRL